jgi:hypothetical protein
MPFASRTGRPPRGACLGLVGVLAVGAPLLAQPPGTEGLRDEVEAQFRVIATSGGIGLLPLGGDGGVALIELRGEAVYLDGDGPLSVQGLTDTLGGAAAPLLRLRRLDVGRQRAVLGLPPAADAEEGTADDAGDEVAAADDVDDEAVIADDADDTAVGDNVAAAAETAAPDEAAANAGELVAADDAELPAVEAGAAAAGVLHCETSAEAAARAAAAVRDGDVVLVKGSRGVRTDLVVTRLRADRAAGSERA